MNATEKRLHDNCMMLKGSKRTLRDIYGIIFSEREKGERTMCETVLPLRVRTLSYGEAFQRIEGLAAAISRAISGSDRYIGLYGEGGADLTVLFWAILRSGNRPCLLSPQSSAEDHCATVKSFGATAVISLCDRTAFPCENLLFSELSEAGEGLLPLPEEAPFGDAVAFMGEGAPEDRVFSGADFAERILYLDAWASEAPWLFGDVKNGARQLMLLPLFHPIGLSLAYLPFCFLGAAFVFPRSGSLDVLLHTARRCEVTHILASPLFWQEVERAIEREILRRDGDVQKQLRKTIERVLAAEQRSKGQGRRLAARRLRELRAKLFPDSVVACLSFGGPLRPSAAHLLGGVGYPLVEGYGAATSVGPSDAFTDENGETVDPSRIEQAFNLYGATHFAVIGNGEEKPMLVIELPEGFLSEEWDRLEGEIDSVNAALPQSMQVREVKYTRDPISGEGDLSIDRAALRRGIDEGRIRLFDRYADEARSDAGDSEIRERIRALMAEILGTSAEEIPGDAHFMIDLGGSSLDYYTLIGELDRAFRVRLPYEYENFGYSLDDFEQLIKELLKAHV